MKRMDNVQFYLRDVRTGTVLVLLKSTPFSRKRHAWIRSRRTEIGGGNSGKEDNILTKATEA